MQKTKLLSVLKTLSEKEMDLFVKWMSSTFFNTNKNLLVLTEYLSTIHPEFADEKIEKAIVAAHVFPNEGFNDSRLRNLVSDLQEQLELFLVWMNLSAKKATQKRLLLEELNKRKLHALFESRLKESRKELNDSGLIMTEHTLYSFLIDQEEYTFHHTVNFGHVYKVFKFYDNEKIIRSATDLYLSHLLYYYHVLLDHETIYGKKDLRWIKLEKLADELYKETGQTNILTEVYLKVIKLLRTRNTKYYFQIKKDLEKKQFNALVDHDKQSVITVLTNFSFREYLNGKEGFMEEILELSELALSKKLCFRDEFISHIFFFNYVSYNVSLGKTEGANRFIKRYSEFLQPHVKESTLNYSNACVLLAEKKYSQALLALSKATYDTPQRFIGIKNILLKIYFEKNDLEPISFVVDSIRHKMISETFYSDYYVEAEKNFLHYFNTLLNVKINDSPANQKKLNNTLLALKRPGLVFHREWLISKSKELKK
jgi:hypothetical protein